MQLILAIDSDPRRSEQLATLVRSRLQVDLVQASSAGEGLHALGDRVPDLILTSPLLSPFDDGVLDEYLRDLGSAVAHVQTLRIPVLSAAPKKLSAARSLFSLGRKKKPEASASAPDGCDPKVFADEIAHYLSRSLELRTPRPTAAPAGFDSHPRLAPEPAAEPVDEPAPHPLVEEFMRADQDVTPIYQPAPAADEPTPVYEPVYAASETSSPYDLVVDEPDDWKEVEPTVIAGDEIAAPQTVTPAPPTGTSASFDAALAAIRAAWVKPKDRSAAAPPATNLR